MKRRTFLKDAEVASIKQKALSVAPLFRYPRVAEMGHEKDNDWKKEPKLYR